MCAGAGVGSVGAPLWRFWVPGCFQGAGTFQKSAQATQSRPLASEACFRPDSIRNLEECPYQIVHAAEASQFWEAQSRRVQNTTG